MCVWGTTQEVIIDGKSISIDSCIANEVAGINKRGILHTLGSCCGHDVYPATIIVRTCESQVVEYYTTKRIPRKRNFYRRDANGMYFLPEVIELCPECRAEMEKDATLGFDSRNDFVFGWRCPECGHQRRKG